MIYLLIILVASVLLNLFLIVERNSLTGENSVAQKKLATTKRQLQNFRQIFSMTVGQLQHRLQYQYVALEFENPKEQEVVKFFLDKLPAVMEYQAEANLPHKKALMMLNSSDGISVTELDKFFKTQERELLRMWLSTEPDALLELSQLMMNKALVAMKHSEKSKKAEEQ